MSLRLLLSAGRGPAECQWAVAELAQRLGVEAGRAGVGVRPVESVAGDARGTFRSVELELSGPGARAFAETWTGTLCWQAPSPYRRGISRKNWYVAAVLLNDAPPPSRFSEADVEIVPVRTGGPGGQHRNKASTAVRATHRPSGRVVVVDTERRLTDNRRLALTRLQQQLQMGDDASSRAASTDRWRTHDDLVRGNPTRTERPTPGLPPSR